MYMPIMLISGFVGIIFLSLGIKYLKLAAIVRLLLIAAGISILTITGRQCYKDRADYENDVKSKFWKQDKPKAYGKHYRLTNRMISENSEADESVPENQNSAKTMRIKIISNG